MVAALVGQVRRVIMDSTGRVIDLGQRRRLFTGAARTAVELTDGRCTWPGCSIPAHRCQIDHSSSTPDGDPPESDNGATPVPAPQPPQDPRLHHPPRPHGQWHIHRPDGTEVAPRPHDV